MFKSISQESTFAVFFIEHSGVYIYGDQRKTTHYAIKNYDYIELSLGWQNSHLDISMFHIFSRLYKINKPTYSLYFNAFFQF